MSVKTLEQHKAELRPLVASFVADAERLRDQSAATLERRIAEAIADGHPASEFNVLRLGGIVRREGGNSALFDKIESWRKNGWL
jgi:hypothetical protein